MPTHIGSVFHKIFVFPRLGLMFPFTLCGVHFRICHVRLVFSFVLNILFLCKIIDVLINGFAHGVNPDLLLCYRVQVLCMFLVIPTNTYWVCLNLSDLNSLVDELQVIDQTFLALGYQPPYTISYTSFRRIMLSIVTILAVDVAMAIFGIEWSLVECTFFVTLFTLAAFIAHSLAELLRMVEIRLELVTDIIELLCRRPCGNRMVAVISLYHRLCDVSLKINVIFSPQILAMIGAMFTNFVVHLFYIVVYGTRLKGSKEDLFGIVDALVWLLGYFLLLWLLIDSHSNVVLKAKYFNANLYRIMIEDKTDEIACNTKLRLHIALQREIKFTACGFFTLDYSLFSWILATTTTYLVILVQFGESINETSRK